MHEKDKEASLDAPTKTQLFVHSSLLEHKLPDGYYELPNRIDIICN